MPTERNSLVQSIRLTENGFAARLRVVRGRPQDLEEFLRENELADRIDFAIDAPACAPARLAPERRTTSPQLTAA
ncbi:MAG: hypothetical protein RJA05_116 [Planctomycetota bacterium]|jgi:hypothetical protein